MVFVVMLSHGRYSPDGINVPDVKVPYNIRLITYTHPRKVLSADYVEYILKQLLDVETIYDKNYSFKLKREVLNVDLDNTTFILKSPPLLKLIQKTSNITVKKLLLLQI